MPLRLIQAFAAVAIFVGRLGLYALAPFMENQRAKKIGIRKVLRPYTASILWLFGKKFLILLCIAFLLVAPLGFPGLLTVKLNQSACCLSVRRRNRPLAGRFR
jgi:putative ABC transport system permease protein